ncbi:hypothetical protein [Dysgonomonas sp.]|jgi:hypothetical protein|uniref:hypothetical protein n=1 Tax=Dysgonomonas sp. TaxID=1891233 RepID=UPI002821AE09|nr:hypothetical protein [Dysgonomonas sp.]MDR2001718.1 hypothetical protein [Prevotella sp.]HMM04298.1 hypothetical protein [Dysgonomonas sp.]
MKKYGILIIPLILILLFFLAFYNLSKDQQNSRSEAKEQIEDYPLLKDIKVNTEINGIISAKELSLNIYNKGSYLIDLADVTKFALYGTSRNYKYEPEPDLNRFVKVGDSISSQVKSDSIFVYRDNQKYYFIFGKIINKKE